MLIHAHRMLAKNLMQGMQTCASVLSGDCCREPMRGRLAGPVALAEPKAVQRRSVIVAIVAGALQHHESLQPAEKSDRRQGAHRCMQEAARAVARLAPMSGTLMPPTRRARAPLVVCIVGAPGHCPAAAAPHRILVGTAHRGSRHPLHHTILPSIPSIDVSLRSKCW